MWTYQQQLPYMEDEDMTKGIATIQIKGRRGHPTVLAMGKTPRGQNYIKELKALEVTQMADPNFKKELATAIAEILA